MDYTSDPSTNQTPNEHDFQMLADIYGHTDGGSSESDGEATGCNPRAPWCNGQSAAEILTRIDMTGPAQWGRLVSPHGPNETYELDLGGGWKILTRVTWTMERAHNHGH